MEINVTKKNEIKFCPKFMGNSELKESDKFFIIMAKQHKLMVQTSSLSANGRFDLGSYVKAHVLRIENPPTINIDGNIKEMTIEDICIYPELEELFTEISLEVTSLQNGKEISIKN